MRDAGLACEKESSLYSSSKSIRDKVWLLRSKLYVHNSSDRSTDEWAQEANFKAREGRRLTVVILLVLSRLRRLVGMKPHQDVRGQINQPFRPYAARDTRGVIRNVTEAFIARTGYGASP